MYTTLTFLVIYLELDSILLTEGSNFFFPVKISLSDFARNYEGALSSRSGYRPVSHTTGWEYTGSLHKLRYSKIMIKQIKA
jgi:hypothetical protein